MATRIALPAAVRNPVSLTGMVVTTVMATVFVALLVLDAAGYIRNPYIGLVLFVAIPAGFVLGLLLIPIGAWWAGRRRHADRSVDWPVLDLRVPRQRRVVGLILALTLANIVIVSLAAYGGVHYMETAAFCGTTCHTTMEPQWVAYQVSPHARVPCVDCHVGPGGRALVESKLAGTRQLIDVVTGDVPKPVPSPRTMRPARETCEGCHWPEKFHGDELRVVRQYAEDAKNTESATTLLLHVGGGSARLGVGSGIHWHMNLDNRIEFVALGPQAETIPYVKLTDRRGRVKEFVAEGTTPDQIASGERHEMDCADCHNRPAHAFDATPDRAVDEAMAQGRIPRELPFVRREAAAAVRPAYSSRDEALSAIAKHLHGFYATQRVDPGLVRRAVAGTQDAWARNVFPQMKVTWGTYPSHIGHVDSPGCFRCHDDGHAATDGSVIRQDCELCHSMPQ